MSKLRTKEFDYDLPEALIAQSPLEARDTSRLLMVGRKDGKIEHGQFRDIEHHLGENDLLVINNSRVIPARLRGSKYQTGAKVELLLLEELGPMEWWSMIRPGKRFAVGSKIKIENVRGEHSGWEADVEEKNEEGHVRLCFYSTDNNNTIFHFKQVLEESNIGETPLPPYINRSWDEEKDPQVYQTVYAKNSGSVAAPTAGLHWTPQLLDRIEERGTHIAEITLHVGAGTFAPVKAATVDQHIMHNERFEISENSADILNRGLSDGRRIIAVGTTSLRVLESAVKKEGAVRFFNAGMSQTQLYVHPPYDFKVVDALVTNFHLPQSTLLMLVSAFASPGEMKGMELIRKSYQEAIASKYRFFSYGDAMFIH